VSVASGKAGVNPKCAQQRVAADVAPLALGLTGENNEKGYPSIRLCNQHTIFRLNKRMWSKFFSYTYINNAHTDIDIDSNVNVNS
jgi:hypothetical protein